MKRNKVGNKNAVFYVYARFESDLCIYVDIHVSNPNFSLNIIKFSFSFSFFLEWFCSFTPIVLDSFDVLIAV